MHTLNMDLSRLMQQGYITREEAMKFTNNKAELTQYMKKKKKTRYYVQDRHKR